MLINPSATYLHVGCFVDKSSRAVPYSGKTFSGAYAVDKCAAIAAASGHRAFGVQYGGQCFTGPQAHQTYSKYGKAANCKNGRGAGWRNDVYILSKSPIFSRLRGGFVGAGAWERENEARGRVELPQILFVSS